MTTPLGEENRAEREAWFRRPLAVAAVGSVLLLLAQPPVSWSLLAWFAPLPWMYLATKPALPGRRPYVQIWAAGFLYWMLAVHWLRLPHPATFVGLLALAAYFGVYLPLFVGILRVGVLRWSLPMWFVAPMVWVAIEWLQGHLLGGFLMAALGHTQIEQTALVQIADLAGGYLISALIMLVAGCIWEGAMARLPLPRGLPPWRGALAATVGVVALGSAAWYGTVQLQHYRLPADVPTKRVALIQGSQRAVWTSDPGRDKRVMDIYIGLSREAKQLAGEQGRPLDLMVWPEGMFRTAMYAHAEGISSPEWDEAAQYAIGDLRATVKLIEAPLLTGIDRVYSRGHESLAELYNAAVAVDRAGEVIGTYDKTHLVMFGEYVPGGELWPDIYRYFPIGGVTPGNAPAIFEIDGIHYMPTICYETVIPHVIRKQVNTLTASGRRPDVLVNVTNDSWFNDSSELAMHLTCSRLRAIECRTPLVAAANGGLSANVDRCGRVLDVSQPVTEQVLLVDVAPGGNDTFYLRYGDTFAIGCLLGTLMIALTGYWLPATDAPAP